MERRAWTPQSSLFLGPPGYGPDPMVLVTMSRDLDPCPSPTHLHRVRQRQAGSRYQQLVRGARSWFPVPGAGSRYQQLVPSARSWFPVPAAPRAVRTGTGLSLSPSSTLSGRQSNDSQESASLGPGHLHGLAWIKSKVPVSPPGLGTRGAAPHGTPWSLPFLPGYLCSVLVPPRGRGWVLK